MQNGADISTRVPEYIEKRIRQRVPEGLSIVPDSTPVVAFGDIRKARVVTIGWNPSWREFLERDGRRLKQRRLEDLSSLGVSDLSSASGDLIGRVFEACNNYFCGPNPFKRYFKVLDKLLRPLGASYFNETACHLDLVQWATDPVWSKLKPSQKETLLRADIPFLRRQLSEEQIELVLLNGSGIADAFQRRLGYQLAGNKVGDATLFIGRTQQRANIIGWNKNLQQRGVTNQYIEMVAKAIKQFVPNVIRPPLGHC